MMRVGSLFAGIGGIDFAFCQAGFEIAWANEFDAYACKTYRFNFPDANLIEQDIRKVDTDNLELVDVLVAGFPCQSFSICGNKQGFNDQRGNLFFEIMRIADVIMPPVIFLENVANLTEHDDGKTFNVIHNELVSRGYYIRYVVTDACDYGIPQHRTRTYVVAFKSQSICDAFEFPGKIESSKQVFDVIDKTVKVEDKYYLTEDSYQYKRLVSEIDDDIQIYRFSDYGVQKSKNGISFTLKANMGTWKDRVPYVKDCFGIRRITPKECLMLQGFPKNFDFDSIPEREMYKQAGNTVCVPVVEMIATKIVELF